MIMGNCIVKPQESVIIEDSTMDDTVCGKDSNYSSSHKYESKKNTLIYNDYK